VRHDKLTCTCARCAYDRRIARRVERDNRERARPEPAVASGCDNAWAFDAVSRRMERA
jgi:hypothetical protein